MKGCARVKRLLSRYIDKEANPAEIVFVDKHIGVCPYCRQELERLLSVKGLVFNTRKEALPSGYMFNLLREELQDAQTCRQGFLISGIACLSRRLIPVPAAAILFSAVLLLLSLFRPQAENYLLYENILKGVPVTTEAVLGLLLDVRD
ncbi:MAG: zf-HC2 domain-containing protein [Candidatus Omnitrophota bacterium]|jgi:anti-sigma factor RsiW